jgi:CheY-like chemotaxis protein
MSSPGTSVAMGRVLLVCNDEAVIEHLTESMHQLAIATEVCLHAETALGLVNLKKFEGIMVDFEMENADQILERLRLSPSNRTAVTFAIAASGKTTGLGIQPNFLMERPLSPASVGRTLKSRFRNDRTGATAFVSLSRRPSRIDPGEWAADELQSGEYQRGRNGDQRCSIPEARR